MDLPKLSVATEDRRGKVGTADNSLQPFVVASSSDGGKSTTGLKNSVGALKLSSISSSTSGAATVGGFDTTGGVLEMDPSIAGVPRGCNKVTDLSLPSSDGSGVSLPPSSVLCFPYTTN